MTGPGRGVTQRGRMLSPRGRTPGGAGSPRFWLLDTENDFLSGVANLEAELTINGTTVTPTFRYIGGDASATNWTADGYGETLTAAGSGGSFNQGSPFMGVDDDSVNPDGTRYWQASGNTFADVATEDMVFEVVFKSPMSAAASLASKKDGTAIGWEARTDTAKRLLFYIDDDVSPIFEISSGGNTALPDTWYHAIVFIDRSDSAQWYINASPAGTAKDVSTCATISNSTQMSIGSRNGGIISEQHIAYVAMWQQASWLDTHLQAAVAQERYQRLCGLWPKRAAGTKAWTAFTRATSAYVDKVEYGAELLPEPLDFSDAAWNKTNSSVTEATGVLTPDGVQAYNLHEDDTAAATHVIQDNANTTAGTIVDFEVDARANNRAWLSLLVGGEAIAYFNLSTGAIGGGSGATYVEHKIRSLGDSWYRCMVRYHEDNTGSRGFVVYVAEANGDITFNGLDQDSLYIANASVKAYNRKLYQMGSGHPRMCRRQEKTSGADFYGYLAERAATNLCTDSEDFTAAGWFPERLSVSTNTATAPDGSTTADTLHEDATASNNHSIADIISGVGGTSYVWSVSIKAINRTWVRLKHHSSTDGTAYACFNLATGAVGTTSGLTSSGIEDWGNGWFRCWTKKTGTANENQFFYIDIAEADNDVTFDGLDQDSLYIWGAQVEASTDYPTSYIATSGAIATRNADVLYYKGDDGNVANNQRGTMECETLLSNYDNTIASYVMGMSDGGVLNDVLLLRYESDEAMTLIGYNGGTPNTPYITDATTDIIDGDKHKLRATWKVNSAKLYVDGVIDGTEDTDCSIADDLDRFHVGTDWTGSQQTNGLLRDIRIWNKPLKP